MAALSYFLFFVTGIVILFVEKEDKFIRFHAMQSTIIFGGLFAANILFGLIFSPIDFLGVISGLINTLISILVLVIWIVSMYKAYRGKVFRWPIIGDFAERRVR